MLIILTLTVTANASPRLYDGADLLSAEEEATLLLQLDDLSYKNGFDIAVVTSPDLMGYYSAESAATEYYEANYGKDGVLLFLSMAERDWYVVTAGTCIDSISYEETEYLSEQFLPQLSDGDYYGAFTEFATEAVWLSETDMYPEDTSYHLFGNIVIGLIVGFVVAFIVTGIMKGQLKSVNNQTRADQYTKHGSMQVTLSRDTFLYRNVTKTKKQSQSSSGSANHSSSSGRSYGGRGGKF